MPENKTHPAQPVLLISPQFNNAGVTHKVSGSYVFFKLEISLTASQVQCVQLEDGLI